MAESTIPEEPTRRDFLCIANVAMGAAGAGFAAWPLIAQMSPDATTLAAASTDVDISNIAEGQVVTVKWGQASLHQPSYSKRDRRSTRGTRQ